jgi:hypothetical protein
MNLNECQLRSMYLAGTVSIPLTFPELGAISLHGTAAGSRAVVRVEHRISPKLLIARSVLLDEVEGVFLPKDPTHVDFADGDWLIATDVGPGLEQRTGCLGNSVLGILYVREHARVLMQVEVGMTAAESVEYYPPMAGDRSVNHYNLSPRAWCAPWSAACGPYGLACEPWSREGGEMLEGRASFWCE